MYNDYGRREYTKRHLVTDDRSNWGHLAMTSHLLVKWSSGQRMTSLLVIVQVVKV